MKKKVDLLRKDEKRWNLMIRDAEWEIALIRKNRDLSWTWIHVDMDMFYA